MSSCTSSAKVLSCRICFTFPPRSSVTEIVSPSLGNRIHENSVFSNAFSQRKKKKKPDQKPFQPSTSSSNVIRKEAEDEEIKKKKKATMNVRNEYSNTITIICVLYIHYTDTGNLLFKY